MSDRKAVPALAFQHAKADVNQLAHGSAQGRHRRLSARELPLLLGSDVRVQLRRYNSCHVERSTQPGIAGFREPRPPANAPARLPINRYQTREGGHLASSLEGATLQQYP